MSSIIFTKEGRHGTLIDTRLGVGWEGDERTSKVAFTVDFDKQDLTSFT